MCSFPVLNSWKKKHIWDVTVRIWIANRDVINWLNLCHCVFTPLTSTKNALWRCSNILVFVFFSLLPKESENPSGWSHAHQEMPLLARSSRGQTEISCLTTDQLTHCWPPRTKPIVPAHVAPWARLGFHSRGGQPCRTDEGFDPGRPAPAKKGECSQISF